VRVFGLREEDQLDALGSIDIGIVARPDVEEVTPRAT
jgi:hypothetical protein